MKPANQNLENNRKHMAAAFIEYCRLNNHGEPTLKSVIGRKVVEINNLTVQSVSRCLKESIEKQCSDRYGQEQGAIIMSETYSSLLSRDNSKLNRDGVDLMNEVMAEVIKAALKAPKTNKFGLEIENA
ncbi:hypothetical protein N4G41_10505 [Kosakonia sacchari]|uniref:hypothetical protein n=1 Tax=Kosakonia sacchari TaxID=1158459 RepID=UPI002ACEE65F|nr:hypothetical protein [Kosakonia sacchari]MDZ7322063.1 hypothetical protein [Kosakonia sacchari]